VSNATALCFIIAEYASTGRDGLIVDRISVALVGRRLEDNDNLGLGYLESALREAGLVADRYDLNAADQVRPIADALIRKRTRLVGLSLTDGGSACLPLVLGQLLARRRFAGHVTAGGPFATLARQWLLERYSWLDSVVRFAGEKPLTALARALEHGLPLAQVPGLTTRGGDGQPACVLDDPGAHRVPVRGHRPSLLGHGVAHIMATRGCAGRCAYCGPAALQSQEVTEGVRAGITRERLRRAGVGGVRRRPVSDVCDEMAALWQGGVRYFYFVDEHLLPYEERQALAFLAEFEQGLVSRRVGAFGVGCMLRAERVTLPVARAFARAGLVRAFVGAEFASAEEGRYYGRRVDPAHDLALIDALSQAGVATVTNLMLVHPEATGASIRNGIRYLERIPSGVFEATRTMVYHGTRLWERMRDRARLTGNPLRYGYALRDPVAQRFSEIFARLRGESFYDHSLAYRTHDAFLSLALAHRLDVARVPDGAQAELERVRREVNALYTSSLSEALLLAEAGQGGRDASSLVRRAAEASDLLVARLGQWDARVADALGTSPRAFSPMRAAAASALSFVLVGAACGGLSSKDPSHTTGTGGGGNEQTGGTRSVPSSSGVGGSGGGAPATAGTGGVVQPGSGGTANECSARELTELADEIRAALPADAARCAYARIYENATQGGLSANTLYWEPGEPLMVRFCSAAGSVDGPYDTEVEEAVASVATPACDLPQDGFQLNGNVADDFARVAAATEDCGPGVRIVLGDDGTVVDVVEGYGGVDEEIMDCYRNVLAGLTFPCLASTQVCPEYVCIE
jgi:radical SAM superfamily enzyme YgiQ (UPF0313 family)